MNRGPLRTLIPHAWCDLSKWPAPDEASGFPELDKYYRRKEAVQMYAADASYGEIKRRTAIGRAEVRRLVSRCVIADGMGNIWGFRALVSHVRVKSYTRTAEVGRHAGQGHGGCSGLLKALHDRFPDVEAMVADHFLKRPTPDMVHEARISYRNLHSIWLRLLREKGLTDRDWPFCAKYRGYNALRSYCIDLRVSHLGRWIAVRSGADASRKRGIGQGYRTLLPLLRPYVYAQLDFHKVDAASIIVVVNEYGVEIEIPVARWHIGFLVEERSQAILAVYISLELTPSGDCVLETVERALRPETPEAASPDYAFVADGKIVINQLIPVLAYQGFAALKMDNAWSNTAVEVYNNIIDTVGCAVNFGPVCAWWHRSLIELIIGRLTRHGLQRMPSTYGVGPADTRRTDPAAEAVKFRILLSQLIGIVYEEVRYYNHAKNEGLQFSSPLDVLNAALAHPASGFFPQPLPKSVQRNMRLLMHVEECTVRGNIKKNVRPYIKTDRCRYTNPQLARRYDLVGKKLVVYVDRRKCRLAYAAVLESGESLGQLYPERRWAQSNCSWRMRRLLNVSGGLPKAYQNESSDGVITWATGAKKDLVSQTKKRRAEKRAVTALKLAKVIRTKAESTKQDHTPPTQPDPSNRQQTAVPRKPPADPFGIGGLPDIPSHKRR